MAAEMEIVRQSAEQLATEPAARAITPAEWKMITEQSVMLEQAGKGTSILPKGITNRYQIAAVLLKGHELGLSAMYSLEQIGLVNGKAVVQGQALTAIIQRAHGGDAIKVIESTNERCVLGFKRRDWDRYEQMEWTIQDAETAGLTGKGGPWKQYPRTMLRWRCVAEGARIHFADTIAGLYLPDEIGVPARVTADGDLVFDAETVEPVALDTAHEAVQRPAETEEAGSTVVVSTDLQHQLNMRLNDLADATGLPLGQLVPSVMGDADIRGKSAKTLNDEERQRVLDVIQTRLDGLTLSFEEPASVPAGGDTF